MIGPNAMGEEQASYGASRCPDVNLDFLGGRADKQLESGKREQMPRREPRTEGETDIGATEYASIGSGVYTLPESGSIGGGKSLGRSSVLVQQRFGGKLLGGGM